jgi:hypothetical protein
LSVHVSFKTLNCITSRDGKQAYLAIVDRSTRYTWVFTSSSKSVPIEQAKAVLHKSKSNCKDHTVQVDQVGEFGRSSKFSKMASDKQFSLEITGSDTSAQNTIVESPNKTFGQMMQCILSSTDLEPEYWSWALQYAVFIKNRIPHQSLKVTPYEKFTGNKPDLSNLQIFGSKFYARKPGR